MLSGGGLVRTLGLNKEATLPAQMDIVVGTPLRMAKLAKKGKGIFSGVEFVVLDEADKLLGEAFVKEIDAIIAACTHPRKVPHRVPACSDSAHQACLHQWGAGLSGL